MPEVQKPVVYILRGDDLEAIKSHVDNFFNSLGTPDMAEMNTTHLAGNTADINDLQSAALALPFLTARRLVVVEDAPKLFEGQRKRIDQEKFTGLLESLPKSTALVLLLPDSEKYQHGQMVWERFNDRHWLIQWAKQEGEEGAIIVDCPLPSEREMPGWVLNKTTEMGGRITPQAAVTLAEYIGNNTQRGTQEIIKLLTYANFERPVDADDVRRLTSQDHQTDVFALVDAIGLREGEKALDMAHLLLEEMDFIPLFGMIIRQFRLLIQAREILDAGGDENDLKTHLHLHPYVAKKILIQAKKFSLTALESIYHQLLEIDIGEKTGNMPGDLALDVLIAKLSN
jgi:DNA polymerase-3 subunit delta